MIYYYPAASPNAISYLTENSPCSVPETSMGPKCRSCSGSENHKYKKQDDVITRKNITTIQASKLSITVERQIRHKYYNAKASTLSSKHVNQRLTKFPTA